jgi:hypothetical protein
MWLILGRVSRVREKVLAVKKGVAVGGLGTCPDTVFLFFVVFRYKKTLVSDVCYVETRAGVAAQIKC